MNSSDLKLVADLSVEDDFIIEHLNPDGKAFYDSVKFLAESHSTLLGKFRECIAFARERRLEPKVVAACLKAAGYPAPRISEFMQIADANEETYECYRSGLLTWRPTLERVREEKQRAKGNAKGKRKANYGPIFKTFSKLAAKHKVASAFDANGSLLILCPMDGGQYTTPQGVHVSVTVQLKGKKNDKN